MKLIGDLTAERSEVGPLKEEAWPDEIDFPKNLKDKVFIKHIKGPLFFGSTSEFEQLYKQIPEGAKTVVIRLSRNAIYGPNGFICYGRHPSRPKG